MTIEFAESVGWLHGHLTAIAKEMTMPEYFTPIDLAGKLLELSIACENKDDAEIMDAASVKLMELVETIDLLRAELQAREEARQ